MNLSDARKAKIPRKKKFPVGRGHSSGIGEWCGRGNKGQYSRQGTSFRMYFEGGQMPIIRRLPKRGFNNAEFRNEYEEVNVGALDREFADGATVDEAALREKKLVRRHLPIKILGDGPMAKKLTVKAHRFTKSAEEKIAKAGGAVVKLEAPAPTKAKAPKGAGKPASSKVEGPAAGKPAPRKNEGKAPEK
jgi:large subunit ribosomal protein L15